MILTAFTGKLAYKPVFETISNDLMNDHSLGMSDSRDEEVVLPED